MSRDSDKLTIKGHQIQVFADLSPYIVQKCHSLKPLLQVLMQKELAYRWAFPFRLNFSHQNKSYSFSFFVEAEHLLIHLRLITQEIPQPPTSRGPSSAKRPSPPSSLTTVWQKQLPKRYEGSRSPNVEYHIKGSPALLSSPWNCPFGSLWIPLESTLPFTYNPSEGLVLNLISSITSDSFSLSATVFHHPKTTGTSFFFPVLSTVVVPNMPKNLYSVFSEPS